MRRYIDGWLILGVIVGIWGGVTRAIKCQPGEFTWLVFFFRVSASAFVSVIVGLVMLHTDYSPAVEAAIIGASGYAAVDILRYVPDIVKRKAGKV